MAKKRFVTEIFGFPPTNKTDKVNEIRRDYMCPFQEKEECDPINKKSNLTDEDGKLLLTHQTGACSVLNTRRHTAKPTIICPYRFLEKNKDNEVKIFRFIQKTFFPDKCILFIPEIHLQGFGRADWMIVEIDENNRLVNFDHLEFQADATTGTRKLVMCVKDFFDGIDVTDNSYSYGLNSKASIKGSSLQMIDKGFLFQKMKKKSFWILQDTLFQILCEVYDIKMIKTNKITNHDNLIFIIPTMKYNTEQQKYELSIVNYYVTSPQDLQKAISNKSVNIDKITPVIEEAISKKIQVNDYYKIKP